MPLGSKALFFATFFRPFLWVFLDVGLTTRSTPSDCWSCVKGSVVVVVGASVEVVSTVRRDMLLANAARYGVSLVFLPSSRGSRKVLTTTTTIGSGGFAEFPPYDVRKTLGFPFRYFLLTRQGLFDAVTRCTADGSQGGRFSRCNGGRYEGQERKESPSLSSTHDPFSTPSSSTFGRHDVFETMRLNRTFLCPKTLGSTSSFDTRSFGSQCLFDTVARCTTDRSQGGRFTRCNGSRCQECQERKESTSLWSFATTHDPFSTSSTFGRHDVFETMKGTRCRHAHLGFFLSIPRRRWPRARRRRRR